jgi:hypothetical protein
MTTSRCPDQRKPLNITLLDSDVRSFRALDETFDPADIITWAFKPNAWKLVERAPP